MKITIVTACRNRARTIADAIESVAAQTHRDKEHIVVDGGSTDGTLEVIERYQKDISRVIPGPDKGIYDALNKGVSAASGDVIAFLHSDDVYPSKDVLARIAAEMASRSLDALYGDVVYVRDDMSRVVRVYSSRRFRPERLAWGWMPAHPALFVRRHLFAEVGPFKTDYAIAGDYEFVVRLFRTPGLRHAYLPAVLVKMRVGGVSTRGLRSTLLLNREVLRACRENGVRTNYFKLLTKYPAKVLEFLQR